MPWFRIAVGSRGFQNLADRDGSFSATNGQVLGKFWGSLLQGRYDGFEVLDRLPDGLRARHASAHEPYDLGATSPQPDGATASMFFAPATWRHEMVFGAETFVAPSFSPAWGSKVNMGSGFDVR